MSCLFLVELLVVESEKLSLYERWVQHGLATFLPTLLVLTL